MESDVPQSNDQQEIDSWYDPEVEFLEIAVRTNGGSRIWKVYGPDLDGSFGSLQGTGGLQTTIKESDGTTTAYLNNRFGDAVATLDGSGVSWNPTVFGGYGRVAGAAAGSFSETQPLSEAMGWRGRRIDSTGLYYLGARYYDPEAGRFISADPLGHVASLSLYDYADGDPINGLDPDGRYASQIYQHGTSDYAQFQRGVEESLLSTLNSLLHPIQTTENLGAALGGLSVEAQVDPFGLLGRTWAGFAESWSDPNQIAGNIGGLTGDLLVGTATGGVASGGKRLLGEIVDSGAGTRVVSLADDIAAEGVTNPIPSKLVRVIPEGIPATTLGRPGVADVFVTAADDIAGMNAAQIAKRLTIPESTTGFRIIEFPTPQSGLASPIMRVDPGFIGGGRTLGGAREFVLPNGPIPSGANIRTIR